MLYLVDFYWHTVHEPTGKIQNKMNICLPEIYVFDILNSKFWQKMSYAHIHKKYIVTDSAVQSILL